MYDLIELELQLAPYGDVTGNGMVNMVDIIALVNIVFGDEEITEEMLQQFDINDDGVINVVDIMVIVEIIMEMP